MAVKTQSSDQTMLVAKIMASIVGVLGVNFLIWGVSLPLLVGNEECGSEICTVNLPSYLGIFRIFEAISFLSMFLFFPILIMAVVSLSLLLNPSLLRRYTKRKASIVPFVVLGFLGTAQGFYWLFAITSSFLFG